MRTKVGVALMVAGLSLLCTCTKPGDELSMSETQSRTRPPVPIRTAAPVPTATSLPSQASATAPSDVGLRELGLFNHTPGNPTVDLKIQANTPDLAIAGERTVYTLTVRNLGPDLATGIVLTDDLPAGVVPVWTRYPQPVCIRQGATVDCNLGELRGNDNATVTLDISMDQTDTVTTGTQLAGLTLDFSTPTCNLGHDENRSTVTCHLPSIARDVAVDVPIGVSVASWMQEPIVHTAIVSSNESDTNRTNNRTAVTMMISRPTVLAATPVPTAVDLFLQAEGPSTVVAGRPFTYTYTVTNRGAMEATHITFVDTLPPATDLLAFEPSAPLCEQINDTLICRLYSPDGGDPVTFTLVITGNAEQPMSLGLDPLAPGWPICAVIKERSYLQLLNCSLGALEEGETTQVKLTLIARGTQERKAVNTAAVYANEPEEKPLDNTRHITTSVKVEADLSVRSTVSGPLAAHESISYTLTISNDGPSDANDVILVDVLPMGSAVISAAGVQEESCQADATTNRVICTIGHLDSGRKAKVAVTVAPDPMSEAFSHSASVSAETDDPDPSNNSLTESIPTTRGASKD